MSCGFKWLMFLLQVSVLALFTACEGGGGGSDDPTVDVTGTWPGTMVMYKNSYNIAMALVQNGSDVTGVNADSSMFTGSVDGNTLYLRAESQEDGGFVRIEMQGPVENNTMSLSGSVYVELTDGTAVSGPASFNGTKR
ncbi:MAG: hypothetical protein PHP44_09755 [Kiritimatiellae bacterium]|nr:hypothetical protein [Kiritimatiellia bacterium]